MDNIYSIAIDGPAGSGKSTIAKRLASRLGILYLSTGALYRALGLKCKMLGLDTDLESDAEKVLDSNIDVKYIDNTQHVFLDGKDVTDIISLEEVGHLASLVSKHLKVRQKCVEIQRQVASKQSMIVDGRDIGSVVLPNAKYKFYLDADVKERAKRRYKDMLEKGVNTTLEAVEKDLIERDYSDTHRKISPLIKCKDAVIIDSSHLSIEEVVEKMYNIITK